MAKELSADNDGFCCAVDETEDVESNEGEESHEHILAGLPPLPADSFRMSEDEDSFDPSLSSPNLSSFGCCGIVKGDSDRAERFLACSLASCCSDNPLPIRDSGEGLGDFEAEDLLPGEDFKTDDDDDDDKADRREGRDASTEELETGVGDERTGKDFADCSSSDSRFVLISDDVAPSEEAEEAALLPFGLAP